MDVPNRWNSTYDLLATALPLKEAFSRLQRIDKQYKFNPPESEWEVAKIVHECLQIFYEATRHFSGRKYPTSNVFFPDVCEVHLKMIEWENSNLMKEKFDKYWEECCLILAVAVVFDPRFKMDLVQYFYTRIYGDNAYSYIQRVRNTLYKLFISYGDGLYESRVLMNQKSELESYLDEPRFSRAETFSILDWWKTNSPKLPILAKIARDILAVPATTVASEAAFSVGGPVIDDSRACLLPDVVEALVVADDWIGSFPKNIVDNTASSET
ncbi:UNVERIFIED_CONTAM: Zinc finger BED domain-containing protein RICESLEEPER 2 [Sesamum radiatum]|uniref:Zinc finger BED domain-containing protein RICESLEEPER 2 n=1 Tax=Sesamum radiatum TaxID=300843 RepID=A0AAW2Q0C4_SESRA